MVKISISDGKYAIVDEDSLPIVSRIKWYLHSQGYATSSGSRVLMHRLILGVDSDMYVDHINGDRLDNRKSNLRLVTPVENSKYRTKLNKNNTSKHRGVFITEDGTFHAYIYSNKKKVGLGYFKSFTDAVAARLKAEREYGIKFYAKG